LSSRAGVAALAFAALLAGCAAGPQAASIDAAAPKAERSGLELEAERLLETDRAFAEESLKSGAPEAFSRFFDAQGMQLGTSGPPAVGPEQVRASLAPGAANILSWEPRFAEVFAPGDWGWTWGEWQLHEPGAGGKRLAQGRYVNLWKKQPDGSWKVRLDHGSVEREP
jgi:hypothetical protein